MEYLKHEILAIVDVETTGTSAVHGRIIEIGILRVENGAVVDTFQSLVNPEMHLSPYIESITGISPEHLTDAPLFSDIEERVSALLDGAIFVAHNARFDYGFVKNEFRRLDKRFNAKCLCTVRLSRKIFPKFKKHDLSSIIERHGLKCKSRHRAYDDADALWQFLKAIEEKGKGAELEAAAKSLLSHSNYPQFLDERTVRNLPEGPGVYTFYGEKDEILYVGKSKNIRYRVLSHFSSDHADTKEMNLCKEIRRVETEETAGELSALLLESKMVKEMLPIYNRQLRKKKSLLIAKRASAGGYATVSLEHVDEIRPEEHGEILGVFRSQAQAVEFLRDASAEHSLCQKILGIEKGKGACFHSQLEKCKGACLGKENPLAYNIRFEKAFESRRIKAWPHKGALLIEERKSEDESQSFVIKDWCLVASISAAGGDIESRFADQAFDLDAYKIFARYISDPAHRRLIRTLTAAEFDSIMSAGTGNETVLAF